MAKFLLILLSAVLLFGLGEEDIKKAYLNSYNYEKMGDYKDAIRVLAPVYKSYPKGYTVNLRLGWLFYLAKKYENSIAHYKVASEVSPASVEPKLGLMRVYNSMGAYGKSLEIGKVVLRIDYYNFYGNYYYAKALEGLRYYQDAVNLDKKMLILYPTSVLFLVDLGVNYFNLNQKGKAKEVFGNVLILDPNNVTAKEYLKRIK